MANALSRAVEAMDCLAASPKGLFVGELAVLMRTSKSTSSRLLASLVQAGLVERDDAERHFLSVHVWTWGIQAGRRLAVLDVARPHVVAAVREQNVPVFIAVVRGNQAFYLESTVPHGEHAMPNLVSYVVPVYACAPGKAILAFSSAETIESVLSSKLIQFTPATLASRDLLEAELDQVRRQGYAINRGEHYQNGSFAIAAPVFGQSMEPMAAVCFYGLPDEDALYDLVRPLRNLSRTISASMGYIEAPALIG